MGFPSYSASNAIIYVTYGAFLIMGTGVAWKMRNQSKADFLSGNGTQTALPLALNFIASALGSGILFSYPELATISGVQGMMVYALASSLPMLIFGYLGPIIRRRCPEGFVLTEWTRQRYGIITMLYLSFMSLVTLFLYMVGELSAIGQVVQALTGLDPLPIMIVQCVITTIYTSLGGFRISFLTDIVQGTMVIGLVIIAAITIGVKTEIQRPLIDESGLTKPNLLGWQLLYILPVAVLTNDFFLSSFWLRTFASKTDKDLRIGTTIATIVILCILTLVGSTGLIAIWSGALSLEDNAAGSGSVAFFILLETLPSWVVGIVLVMVVTLSTAAFDSLQSAMVSSGSNDLFRNKLNIWYCRAIVVLIIIPVIVIALKAPSVLQIWLITDLISAATIPVLVVGLIDKFYWWRGFEVVVGGLGGILTVFIFGCVYYGNAQEAGELLLVQKGLYGNDWSAFGAFVAAPVGSLLWGCGALVLRITFQYVSAKVRGHRFDALDRPLNLRPASSNDDVPSENLVSQSPGKFF
ncbi:Ff.00g050270.m01.CDS01 [Fusarium sp. VM40]|nr:Ff.00g050270.m01.CDS01 [Fusarium sp. VM40]